MPDEEHLADLPLVDHHCHGVYTAAVDEARLESSLTEGEDAPTPGTTNFDSPVGLGIRRWCAPVLDLPVGADRETYIARRLELGDAEVARRLLRAAGLERLLVETGYQAGALATVEEMGALAGAPAHEVVRLESVAESLAEDGVASVDYPDAFAAALREAARDAVGLKSIVAYRGGFDFDPSPPDRRDVVAAVDAWRDGWGEGEPRLADPVLLRFGIWAGADLAAERGLPIQFHVGLGDPDARLHRVDPSLLAGLLERLGKRGVQVALLHCYPHHRTAAHLAWVYEHVTFDVGLPITFAGPSAGRILREAFEIAPFRKHLYSSDALGLPELVLTAACGFRAALAGLLEEWVRDRMLTAADADRVAELVASGNARRVYPLAGAG